MSFIFSNACMRLKCPGVAKNVLMQLAEICNDDGYAWPSLETLCMRTDWSRSAVIEAIAWLEGHKAIRPDRTNGRKTVYWITPDEFTGERHAPKEPANQSGRTTGPPKRPVRQNDHTRPPTGRDQSAKTTLTPRNTKEHQTPPTPASGGTPGFDAIAADYPRRARIEAARRVWNKLSPDATLQAEIARALQAWRRSAEWQREEGRYIPTLGDFLRNRRWLDAPATAAPAAGPAAAPVPEAPAAPMPAGVRDKIAVILGRRSQATEAVA